MSGQSTAFINHDNLPVEHVMLSVTNAGVVQQIKALDPYWVEGKELILYEKPPSSNTQVLGAVETWKAKMTVYLEDVKWLLSLNYHSFWSTILYHPQCMDTLVSFLQEASPPYLPPHESRDVQKLYGEIRRLVLIVFSRLVTNRESKTQWMTKEFMSDLIYNKFIFTIPVIWDICLTYGVDNGRHVSRILDSVFALQPQYGSDAADAVVFVNEAFKYIILQVNKDYDSEEPPNLPETFKGFSEIRRPSNSKKSDKLTFDVLKDLVVHLLDTAMTLRIFIEVYPKSVDIFRKTNFVLSIVQLYEYGIPQLYEKLEETGNETSVTYTEVENYIDCARAELIDVFREMLANYLAVMMDGLSEKLLIKDYHACYPVNEDLDMLRQAYPDIDSVKTDFILQAIYSNLDDPVSETIRSQPQTITNGHIETIDNEPGPFKEDIPDNIKEESLISEVRDLLPHLGDGFILKCLKHYGFNAERVINVILEDNLAEPLRGLDQTQPIIPEDLLDKKFLETGIQRLNVFDGDEFDMMTRDDVDLSKVHVGKKRSKYKDLKDMLNDKTEVKKRIDIYSKYNLVCDDVAMYSDEYDDTYDSDGVTPTADTESEEEFEHNDEEEKAGGSKSRMDFCVNPEEMRARREANFQARRGKGHRPPPPKNVDVVGKPKGQGQEKEVVQNRANKDKHKSSRANHNRRQGAQWKRSHGMVPS
ncbi:hypothetical protein K1T71_009946 [Dendrolimus kikuchii]|uniref:Uncharacterized protein n=1 Tax=Dendrolimus kikuchii TaxID=765133 RepID=A0ACC1CTG2_9NEOP|nr:hypothetical protein K1T71_009946 [Dendrolimus kikuchii]